MEERSLGVARRVEQMFEPIVHSLTEELMKALILIWHAGPESVEAMRRCGVRDDAEDES